MAAAGAAIGDLLFLRTFAAGSRSADRVHLEEQKNFFIFYTSFASEVHTIIRKY